MIVILLSLKLTVIIIEFVNTEGNQNNSRNAAIYTTSLDLNVTPNYIYDDTKSSISNNQYHAIKKTNNPDTKNTLEEAGVSINVINDIEQTQEIDNYVIYGEPFHQNTKISLNESIKRRHLKENQRTVDNRTRSSKICENGCMTSWKPISEIQFPNKSIINKDNHVKYESSLKNIQRNKEKKYISEYERNKNPQEWYDEPQDKRPTKNIIEYAKHNHDSSKEIAQNLISNYNKSLLARNIYPEEYYPNYHDKWYDDPYGWHPLKDLYNCKKYCHCCKDHTSHFHGYLDKFLHFFKYFSFNNYYHKRSSFEVTPLKYLKNPYLRYDYDDSYYDHHDDEFVHFDDFHGEPDYVTECKDLCSCCHSDIILKFKKKILSFKWARLKKRKLHGLFGLIKNLVFSKTGECKDCGEDKNGRSLEDPYEYDHHDWHANDHYPFYETEHHNYDLYNHHLHYKEWFDCSRCCKYCQKSTIKIVKVYDKGRRKRRKKSHGMKVYNIIKRFLRKKFGYDDEDDDDDYQDYDEDRDRNRRTNSNGCCGNFTGIKALIIVMLIAVIIIQCFSPLNILIIVIIPVIAFGTIMIFMFFIIQAMVPLYFTPIIGVVFIIIGAPVLLTAFGFFISLPITLSPIFLPFILNASTGIIYNFPNITYPTLPTNCTTELTTESTTFKKVLLLENTEDIKNSENIPTTLIQTGQENSNNFFSRITSFFGSKSCLERIGCHTAVVTNWIHFYNGFIYRILENLTATMKNMSSKFIVYKEAYRIGSIRTTSHEKCSILYYCKALS